MARMNSSLMFVERSVSAALVRRYRAPVAAVSMIPKKPAPHLMRGGHRFSEKIMLEQVPTLRA
jgi:hypothetical protein